MVITPDVRPWSSIADPESFKTLLVGNGLSINVWPSFNYGSLFREAQLPEDAKAIFTAIESTNFEEALRRLAEARTILDAANKEVSWIDPLYTAIRDRLFMAVHQVHIPWNNLPDSTKLAIGTHLCTYQSIFTTNYDLILYWARMHVDDLPGARTADLMWGPGGTFDRHSDLWEDWTGIYYLHGGLHLWRSRSTGTVGKWQHQGSNILEQVANGYDAATDRQPLFVSEGSSVDKLRAIQTSEYLSIVARKLVDDTKDTVVFGSALSASDNHIVEALAAGASRRIAISVCVDGQSTEQIVQLKADMHSKLRGHTLLFFDSATHPLGVPVLRPSASKS